jgi:FkbM family methyltransferase
MAKRVISVEPVEANLRVARHNVSLAALKHKVALRRFAVAPRPRDHIRLFFSQGNYGGHSISAEHAAQWGAAGYEDVPAIALGELFDREQIGRCSLLKCDIEGSEFAIVDAAPPELLARIDRIIMEVHLTAAEWRERQFEAVRRKLLDCGFSVVHEPIHDRRGRLKRVIMLSATNGRARSPQPSLHLANACADGNWTRT